MYFVFKICNNLIVLFLVLQLANKNAQSCNAIVKSVSNFYRGLYFGAFETDNKYYL